jgi:hypothetical protein
VGSGNLREGDPPRLCGHVGILESLPLKSLIPIFAVSFLMVFTILFMMEPAMYCGEDVEGPTGCMVTDFNSFITGLLAAGVLFLIDMGLLYMTLGDLFMPRGAGDQ